MSPRSKYFIFLNLLLPLFAADVDSVKSSASDKVNHILEEGARKRALILSRFEEFKTTVQKSAPGVDLQIPITPDHPEKMRIMDHNQTPGFAPHKRIFANVIKAYRLRTWHSETDSTELDRVKEGDQVEVLLSVNLKEQGLAWTLVRTTADSEGYIPESYLGKSPDQEVPSTAKKEDKYVYIADGLRMRSEPWISGDFLVLVPYNTDVTVIAYSPNKDAVDGLNDYWAKINYDEKSGWVYNGYLRPLDQKPKPDAPVTNPSGFDLPIHGKLSEKFGPRVHPITKKVGDPHYGVDIAAAKGSEIRAAKDGEVVENAYNKYAGNWIKLQHEGKVSTRYYHQSRTKALKGTKVKKGDVIGYVGTTGMSTGPHLHFEVRIGEVAYDPLNYITLP